MVKIKKGLSDADMLKGFSEELTFENGMYADEKDKVEITLDFKPRSIRFLNCTGACKNHKVVIDYIAPYKVAAFEAEY